MGGTVFRIELEPGDDPSKLPDFIETIPEFVPVHMPARITVVCTTGQYHYLEIRSPREWALFKQAWNMREDVFVGIQTSLPL